MKKTIVFYIATLTRGGAERVIVSLANYFYRQGYEVWLATLEEDEGLYPIEDGIRRVVFKYSQRGGLLGRIRAAKRRITGLRRLLKTTQAQALVSFIGKTNLRAVLAALGTKTKVFLSVRSAPEREYAGALQRLLAKGLFCLADGIVFQSEGAKGFFPKTAQKKSRILYNPLSPEFIRPLFSGKRRDEIVTVGRMDEVKNHALLIGAFAIVKESYPGLRLTIYGDGEQMEAVKEQARALGLSESVNLPGDCGGIAEKIQDARIFVLSSNYEGMPNAVAEAFALGIPVVSTDCPSGGAKMLIGDEERGLLVPVGDAEAMAAAILRILDHPELEEKLRAEAYHFSETLHLDKIGQMWKEYIEETC